MNKFFEYFDLFLKNSRAQFILVIIFFVLYLVLGLSVYSQYGLSWDEHVSRLVGLNAYDFIVGNNKNLLSFFDKDYGPVFQIILIAA